MPNLNCQPAQDQSQISKDATPGPAPVDPERGIKALRMVLEAAKKKAKLAR